MIWLFDATSGEDGRGRAWGVPLSDAVQVRRYLALLGCVLLAGLSLMLGVVAVAWTLVVPV